MIADDLAQRLAVAQVTHLFGVPGGGSTELIRAASDAGIPFILTRTETGGAFMAAAQAELRGNVGVCITGLGPGLASAANGMAHALLDRVPLLVIADALAAAPEQIGIHQRLNQPLVTRGLVKATLTLNESTARVQLQRAIERALEAPPGPVHVDAIGEVLSRTSGEAPTPDVKRVEGRSAHSVSLPASLSAQISAARRPVLIAGLQVRTPLDAGAVRDLAQMSRVPALVTYKAKGVVPDNHPYYAGIFTNGIPEQGILDQADLIVMVGVDPVELLQRRWPYRQPLVHIGAWPPGQSQLSFSHIVIGDIATLAEQVGNRMQGSKWTVGSIAAHRRQQSARLSPLDRVGLSPQRIVTMLAEAARPDDYVTVDAGAHMLPVMAMWPGYARGRTLISNGLSSMGFAVPAAIGAALTDPPARVWAVTGDGGMLMCLGELATLAKEGLNVKVVVMDDERLSLIALKQAKGTPHSAMTTGVVDWAGLGAAMGISGVSVGTTTDLDAALDAAAVPGPFMIAVRVNAAEYPRIYEVLRG